MKETVSTKVVKVFGVQNSTFVYILKLVLYYLHCKKKFMLFNASCYIIFLSKQRNY